MYISLYQVEEFTKPSSGQYCRYLIVCKGMAWYQGRFQVSKEGVKNSNGASSHLQVLLGLAGNALIMKDVSWYKGQGHVQYNVPGHVMAYPCINVLSKHRQGHGWWHLLARLILRHLFNFSHRGQQGAMRSWSLCDVLI